MAADIFEKEHFVIELRKLLAVKNDREMADLLGVQLQTVATWRRKGTTPSLMIRRAILAHIAARSVVQPAPAQIEEKEEEEEDIFDICERMQASKTR